MKAKKIVVLIISLFLFSCNKNKESVTFSKKKIQAGVAITFDDTYVDQWYNVDKLLGKYNWKATFFISQFNSLSYEQLNKLKRLKNKGNEIGGHGWIHLKAATFEKNNGKMSYLDEEILPMIESMRQKSFPVHSFAYPYGSRDSLTDTILLHEFNIIRGTTYGHEPPNLQKCYFDDNSRVLYGLGIDNNYPQFSIPYFLSLLKYAKENNKVVIFYAHKPVLKATAKYETEYKTLIEISKYVQANNMKFYTVSELYLKEMSKI
ncbi:Polysaccharide deacetylase [Flavobacterium segetis]|uniref:Polysaccharide deacetylase n=1 Tax=Flavobacterium segetis TaxID=271157 RepID=A0A1M5FTW4_9FLAO|nr:polysaccharide deacetylase family protein [Flavobacterium segetis]SHF94943.1 Polysaccharide deacetylase [Flavobacterium segetis]